MKNVKFEMILNKHAIILTILIVFFSSLVFLSNSIAKKVEQGNLKNDKLFNEINATIPREEISHLLETDRKLKDYENLKTSFSIYETWNFLSRIIPASNSTEKLTIDGPLLNYDYINSNIKDHLTFLNTLDFLKKDEIIKDYKVEKIEEQVEDKTFTYYKMKIELNIGTDFYRGVRNNLPILDTGDNLGLLNVQKIRTFLSEKGNDQKIVEFLKFNK